MDHEERRELVQGILDDLREQREVDLRGAMEALIHLVFELDDDIKALEQRVSEPEGAD